MTADNSFNKRDRVRAAVAAILGATTLVAGVVIPAQAQGQTSATGGTPVATQLEEVTVTGTRIKRTTDFTTATPTTVIDSTAMDNLGIVNVGAAMSMTPANVPNFTPANTGNSSFFTGSYIPDLRGLNPFFGSRTLTLINTRRAVQTDQGDSFDLNFIPQVLVQRIDTVTGGASAAYGSGAIGGVVNVILDNKLEGGKVNVDYFQTNDSDGRDRHASAAFGHGLFDNRVHFVIGGEYEKQDQVGCQNARTWCAQDRGFYQTGAVGNPAAPLATYSVGSNLRSNIVSETGAFVSPTGSVNSLQATPDGTGTMAYTGGTSSYVSGSPNSQTVEGGQGNPINKYTNLTSPVSRGLITGMLTAKITDNINFSSDVNWGQVQSVATFGGSVDQPFIFQPFLSGQDILSSNAFVQQAAQAGNPSLLNAVNAGYNALNKDWSAQIPLYASTSTTVKRASAGFDGKFGDSSWTWDSYAQYGLTKREQYEPGEKRGASYAMALDSVLVNGQPECRVTAAGGISGVYNPANPYFNPGASYASFFTAPSVLATNSLLAQGCVPLNPFGTQPVSTAAQNYAFGYLDERLRYEQTVVALNATGDIWKGVGAGAFSLATGFEWRQEVGHNDEVPCAAGDAVCQARVGDFAAQFGTPFGGMVTVDEAYLELNLPLLKDLPFAKLLDLDIAGRESRYDNKALYGFDVQNGAQTEGTHNLTTWKINGNFEPIEGIRFRGSQSRDSRAPNFRELYYGQILASGATGGFGYCSHPTSVNPFGDPCTINLLGNVNLRPETSDTTTFGIVLTPPQIPGLNFSADWFHIRLANAIEQASNAALELNCTQGQASACAAMQFNPNAYNSVGAIVAPGTPGSVTGAAAWQAGIDNATAESPTSYNGAYYDVRGVDFSLGYLTSLPDGSTLSTRMLTTWTGEQVFQTYAGGPVYNILGQTGSANNFLNDNSPAAKWRGNMSITWAKGGFSTTPSVNFVGHGLLNYLGVTPSQTALYNKVVAGDPSVKAYGYTILPYNYVPSYFVFSLNMAYSFDNIAGLKGLQVFTQVNNLFNKEPPLAASPGLFNSSYAGTNPLYFDTMGLAYRMGFRMTF